ncbi:unnamed protein product (macronuclear) [Paramecium tetraurelia]|uniref:HMG box domain-containing protein n=1 Tax=Paramecium tetraurelia TaxID=5888 RepID=A0D5X0_PARTE|nr:uncharacterized protein GSPATT00013867001 [Paramecium tetraurelia]CAK78437.1 unnamed protein product [Paramecium tetraurelia]|eukprot:XP_001445834.1 hypothetical protein (macronuclear) [Paramecium tetraurelia strain d4-2]
MNNNQSVPDIGEQEDDLQTIKKTENEDFILSYNQCTEQSSSFGRKLNQQLWQEFYKQELIYQKRKNPQANHNELTSLISKKWKSKKQDKKTVNKLKLKIKLESIADFAAQTKNNKQIAILNKEEQKDDLAEKLKTSTFKLIYLDNICELKGEAILEAIKGNLQLIYINKSNDIEQLDISNQDKSKSTKSCPEPQEQKESFVMSSKDSENEPVNDENESYFEIANNIMNYL